jgi:glutathione peroxidase
MADLTAIPLTRIDGSSDTLAQHAGKVLLVVNVASKCGLTPQYEGLEKLYEKKKAAGLEVLGFPANDFGAQEPGSHEEIVEFCKVNYGVSFPLFAKADVTGPGQAAALCRADRGHAGKAGRCRRLARAPARLWHDADRRSRSAVELRKVPDRQGRQGRRSLFTGSDA